MAQERAVARFSARNACFTLPLQPGQRVLSVGVDDAVNKSLRLLGMDGVTLRPAADPAPLDDPEGSGTAATGSCRWPFDDVAFDHVIVSRASPAELSVLAVELGRVLRPGGSAYLGLELSPVDRLGRSGKTVRQVSAVLAGGGLDAVRFYGVRPSLRSPRYLVPLDSWRAREWFTAVTYHPPAGHRWPASTAMTVAGRLGFGPALFPGLAVVLRRRGRVA